MTLTISESRKKCLFFLQSLSTAKVTLPQNGEKQFWESEGYLNKQDL
jgi:hypothetical protein